MYQFQESQELVRNMGGFSVTMENVSQKWAYVILIMTVEITAMNRGQMELFVVGT